MMADYAGAVTLLYTVGLVVGVLVFARVAQRRLMAQTAAELERTIAFDEETTTVEASCEESSAEQFGELRKRLNVMELDEGEQIATDAFVEEETASLMQRAAQLKPERSPYKFDSEKKLAAEVEGLFEALQSLWPVEKTARAAQERLVTEQVRDLIAQIIAQFAAIDAKYKEDRVSASQCMSMCCTALMKHDGLYVLDSIRKACDDAALAGECQRIIEKAVPNIWAT